MIQQPEPGKLSKMELEVMREVWGMTYQVTVARLLEIFSVRHGWKTSTLSTILDRLIEKKYLTKTAVGKANVYTAAMTEAAHKEYETKMFLNEVHNGDMKSFIAALADGSGISAAELAEIRAWFNDKAGEL